MGGGVDITALLMLDRVSSGHFRCAFGQSDAVRAVPRYPPGRVSSCDIIGILLFPIRTLARRACFCFVSLCFL